MYCETQRQYSETVVTHIEDRLQHGETDQELVLGSHSRDRESEARRQCRALVGGAQVRVLEVAAVVGELLSRCRLAAARAAAGM